MGCLYDGWFGSFTFPLQLVEGHVLAWPLREVMTKKAPRNWLVKERKINGSGMRYHFSRAEWKYLGRAAGVEKSLDAKFGEVLRDKNRFKY